MDHEEYVFFKELGICTHCRRNKAIKGKTLCLACARENKRKTPKIWTKKASERAKEEYRRRKSLGLCTNCGKYAKKHGLICTHCYQTICLRKERERNSIPRYERPDYGMCYICGDLDLVEGKRVCHACYETRMESVSKIMYMPKRRKHTTWSELKC